MIKDVENDYINQQLSDYKVQKDYLKNYEGIYYTVVENDKTTLSNVSANSGIENYYKALPYSVQLTNKNINEFLGTYHYAYSIPENTTVHLECHMKDTIRKLQLSTKIPVKALAV